MKKYTFSIFQFTSNEIDMICGLVRLSSNGYGLPVKRASLTKQVIKYALNWSLLETRGKRLYFPQFSAFNIASDLPVECLWRMVSPMLNAQGSTGYSIVNNQAWKSLNIYPQNNRFASDRDLEEKEEILIKLNKYHYIHLQMAGSVWCIYQEEQAA